MDNLTHTLTGYALANAGLGRVAPRATLVLLIAANLPDIDMASLAWGPEVNLAVHRGYTHSLLLLPLMALVAALIVAVPRRLAAIFRLWMVACAGVASHLLLDWTNTYGIRLLLPFSARWFYLDSTYLYDLVIFLVLGLTAFAPVLGRLVSDEIGSSRSSGSWLAIAALLVIGAYDGARLISHRRAVEQLEARVYDGEPPAQAAAFPHPINPFGWTGLVETSDRYRIYEFSVLDEFDPTQGKTLFKAQWRPALSAARRGSPFQALQQFARFPLWASKPGGAGLLVSLTDLRFGRPFGNRFEARADVTDSGKVRQSRLILLWPGSTSYPK